MSMSNSEPLVSIVTPVYNGEKYIEDCIKSVLSQSYQNWEYTIVNNCSKDNTLEIAEYYAKKDSRIKVHNNKKFLSMIDNFNHAMNFVSEDSKYCKVIHADDMLFPDCVKEMVDIAEKYPLVGIVGSYVLEGVRVKCDGLPYPSPFVSGRDICRYTLLDSSPVSGGFYVFGSPTTLLIRSDLVRSRNPFYNKKYFQVVDQEVCYYLLKDSDFGFIHKVLTYSRIHEGSTTSSISHLNRLILESLMLLIEYGPHYLKNGEFQSCLNKRMDKYYRFLAKSFFEKKDKDFWSFHRNGLKNIGIEIEKRRLTKYISKELLRRLIRLAGSKN